MAGTLNCRRVQRALGRCDCILVRRAGSHFSYRTSTGQRLTLPLGHREVIERLVRTELERVGMDWDAFMHEY